MGKQRQKSPPKAASTSKSTSTTGRPTTTGHPTVLGTRSSSRIRKQTSAGTSSSGKQKSTTGKGLGELTKKYTTMEALNNHLEKLDKSKLQALLLEQAFPEAAPSALRECVYCHKSFVSTQNSSNACRIEHFYDMYDSSGYGDEYQFPCCGKVMSYVDWDEGHARPEDEEPYCYEGRHWSREICSDDDEEETGVFDDWGTRYQKTWWREWKTKGE